MAENMPFNVNGDREESGEPSAELWASAAAETPLRQAPIDRVLPLAFHFRPTDECSTSAVSYSPGCLFRRTGWSPTSPAMERPRWRGLVDHHPYGFDHLRPTGEPSTLTAVAEAPHQQLAPAPSFPYRPLIDPSTLGPAKRLRRQGLHFCPTDEPSTSAVGYPTERLCWQGFVDHDPDGFGHFGPIDEPSTSTAVAESYQQLGSVPRRYPLSFPSMSGTADRLRQQGLHFCPTDEPLTSTTQHPEGLIAHYPPAGFHFLPTGEIEPSTSVAAETQRWEGPIGQYPSGFHFSPSEEPLMSMAADMRSELQQRHPSRVNSRLAHEPSMSAETPLQQGPVSHYPSGSCQFRPTDEPSTSSWTAEALPRQQGPAGHHPSVVFNSCTADEPPASAAAKLPLRRGPIARYPPGFHFRPTDEELITYYLRRKIAGLPLPFDVFADVDLYLYHPKDLVENYKENGEGRWYFFTRRKRKYPNGERPNRGAANGYWRMTGVTITIMKEGSAIGERRSLVFYEEQARTKSNNKTNAPSPPPKRTDAEDKRTDWVMQEYTNKDSSQQPQKPDGTDMWDEMVLCTLQKKRGVEKGKFQGLKNVQRASTASERSNSLQARVPSDGDQGMQFPSQLMLPNCDQSLPTVTDQYEHINGNVNGLPHQDAAVEFSLPFHDSDQVMTWMTLFPLSPLLQNYDYLSDTAEHDSLFPSMVQSYQSEPSAPPLENEHVYNSDAAQHDLEVDLDFDDTYKIQEEFDKIIEGFNVSEMPPLIALPPADESLHQNNN